MFSIETIFFYRPMQTKALKIFLREMTSPCFFPVFRRTDKYVQCMQREIGTCKTRREFRSPEVGFEIDSLHRLVRFSKTSKLLGIYSLITNRFPPLSGTRPKQESTKTCFAGLIRPQNTREKKKKQNSISKIRLKNNYFVAKKN